MPDRDVFQRCFKGLGPLGWQGIARLLNYEPGRLDVDQNITKALARTLRKLPPNFIRNVVVLLGDTMAEVRRSRLLGIRKDGFLDLCYKLRIENGGNAFEVAEVIKEAAQSFYLANRERSHGFGDGAISDGFADKIAEKLIDAQMFSKIRDVLQSNSGRDAATEISWEREILNRALPNARKMLQQYLAVEGKAFRAPIVRGTKRKSTEELLNEFIAVLPTGARQNVQ